jgi:hypothetical protein
MSDRRERFLAYLQRWMPRPFELGVTDCVSFVGEWVDAECGTKFLPIARERYTYTTRREALTQLHAGGYTSMVQEITGVIGETDPDEFEMGDVGMFQNDTARDVLGLIGERLIYAPATNGLIAVDVQRTQRVWKLSWLTP